MARVIEYKPKETIVVPEQFIVSLSDKECHDLMTDLLNLGWKNLRPGTLEIYNTLSYRKAAV